MQKKELEKQIKKIFYNAKVRINEQCKTVDVCIDTNDVSFEKLEQLSTLLQTKDINIVGEYDRGERNGYGYYYGGGASADIHCRNVEILSEKK